MKYIGEHKIALLIIVLVIMIGAFFTYSILEKNSVKNAPAYDALTTDEESAEFTDLEGNEVTLIDELGNILIVTSWASWSPQSKDDLVLLGSLVDDYGDTISVVAINRAEDKDTSERFLKHIGVEEKVQLVLDPDDSYYDSIDGYAMPETIIYDKEGEVVLHVRGPMVEERVKEVISQIE